MGRPSPFGITEPMNASDLPNCQARAEEKCKRLERSRYPIELNTAPRLNKKRKTAKGSLFASTKATALSVDPGRRSKPKHRSDLLKGSDQAR